jgi:hypothetical protein
LRKTLGLALGLALSLTACSGTNNATQFPSHSSNTQELSPEQAKVMFMGIARASCDRALEDGVVEQSIAGEGLTLVMVPKNDSYLDFSAAYYEPEDVYEVIWEADAFSSCGASISFDLAEEAGVATDISVTFDPANSTFETTQDFGDFGIIQQRYSTSGGLISKVESQDSNGSIPRTVRYGNLKEADWNILRTAVDRFLENSQ